MEYTQVRIFQRKLKYKEKDLSLPKDFDDVVEDLTEVNQFLKEVDNLIDIKAINNDILVIYNIKD